jgi:dTDP-4-dehydrorhamnose 3,5-epimerase-like enzyme
VLTFAEEMRDIPFELKRMFWITEVPAGAKRGGHAHTTCKELLCCVSGSFKLVVFNGREKREFFLNKSDYGVIIPEGVWCSLEDFSENTVVLVGASEEYSDEGYIRDFDEYQERYCEM